MGWQNLIGFILPPIIDLINKRFENGNVRFLLAFAVSFVVALIFNWGQVFDGNWDNVLGSIGIIFTEAQAVYKLYWRESAVRSKITG